MLYHTIRKVQVSDSRAILALLFYYPVIISTASSILRTVTDSRPLELFTEYERICSLAACFIHVFTIPERGSTQKNKAGVQKKKCLMFQFQDRSTDHYRKFVSITFYNAFIRTEPEASSVTKGA